MSLLRCLNPDCPVEAIEDLPEKILYKKDKRPCSPYCCPVCGISLSSAEDVDDIYCRRLQRRWKYVEEFGDLGLIPRLLNRWEYCFVYFEDRGILAVSHSDFDNYESLKLYEQYKRVKDTQKEDPLFGFDLFFYSPHEESITFKIEVGDANSEDLIELYNALSELHRAYGGVGIILKNKGVEFYEEEEVSI